MGVQSSNESVYYKCVLFMLVVADKCLHYVCETRSKCVQTMKKEKEKNK